LTNNYGNGRKEKAMEKIFGEEEFKGLEEEIDLAIEKLFVEKKGASTEAPTQDPMDSAYSYGMIQDLPSKLHTSENESPPTFSNSFEKMETQLLSLEWEFTKENIEKTRQEVLACQKAAQNEPQVINILNWMAQVLNHIWKNDKNITPPLIKFLLDSKETIKLLMKKDGGSEIAIYKQLVYSGIEARFNNLEAFKEKMPDFSKSQIGEMEHFMDKNLFDKILKQMSLISSKMDDFISKLDDSLLKLKEVKKEEKSFQSETERKNLLMNITVVKVDHKLFGVETDRVVKLFKVPRTFFDKYLNRSKIQLKEFEVKLIDLNKVFSIPRERSKEEFKILTVKDNGFYKGLIIDEVIKRLSAYPDARQDYGEYFLGFIYTIYQDESVEIPILDVKKF
jgi:hypothetical protein